jgi:Mg2+/Co2+ transporter CorB
METIPDAGVKLMVDGYTMEVMQATGNAIRSVRVVPPHVRK